MTADEYQNSLLLAYRIAQVAASLPLAEMLSAISHSDAIAPILDPTLYREKASAMAQDANLLRALRPVAEIGRALEKGGA